LEGKGKEHLKEEYYKDPKAPDDNKTRGSAYADVSYDHQPINSVNVKKTDGLPVARERRGLEKLGRLVGEEAIPWVKKLLAGYGADDKEEVQKQAREACRETFRKIENKLGKTAEDEPADQETAQ